MNPLLQMTSCRDAASPFQAPDELVRALTQVGKKRRVECGERVISFGEAADGVYLIEKGTARAALPGEPGEELVCHKFGPGSLLGLPSALCSTRYQFDVEALETVQAVYLQTESVNAILRKQPELCMKVMSMMCDELSALRQTRDHMTNCRNHSCSLHDSCNKAINQ